jgi:hypothetical protein
MLEFNVTMLNKPQQTQIKTFALSKSLAGLPAKPVTFPSIWLLVLQCKKMNSNFGLADSHIN